MADVILYNKNQALVKLKMQGITVIQIGDVINQEMLPICLQNNLTNSAINTWIQKRLIPDNRDGLAEARMMFGSFENYGNMASLTDQYWFRRKKEESWDKVNFFTNKYPTAIGTAQFEPWKVDKKELRRPSPDLATNGLMRKAWVQDETLQSWLIKAGSRKLKQEPLSEVLASITLGKMQMLPYVRYDLCIYGMRICSKCRCFVTKNTEFVPAKEIYATEERREDDTVYSRMVRAAENHGVVNAGKFIDHMILTDMVIGNADRHLGNFGFLRSAKTGKIIGFAPLFDFGGAFWPYDSPDDNAAKTRAFANQQKRVLKQYATHVKNQVFAEKDVLYDVIDKYPDLSVEEKQHIKDGIEQREAMFNRAQKYRSERSR